MRKSQFILRRAWVALLVLFAVGLSCVPFLAFADTVEWTSAGDAWVYTSASAGDVFVTNITFVSIEDYDEFVDDCVDRITYLQGVNNALGEDISSAQSSLTQGVGFVGYAKDSIANARDENDDFYVNTELGFADRSLDNSLLMFSSVSNRLASVSDKQVVIRDELSSFRSYLRTDNTSHLQINLVWTNANGSCSCPDYTSILESIEGYISEIHEVVLRWDYDFYEWVVDIVDNFWYGNPSPGGSEGFYYDYTSFWHYFGRYVEPGNTPAGRAGMYLGNILSNLNSNVRYPLGFSRDLYNAAMFSGASLYGPNLAGDYNPVVRLVWNGLMKPLADALNPSSNPWASDNNLFAGYFRDYYINPPTNVTANVVSSPDNPVWVAFTNSVRLDFDLGSLSSVAVTNFCELVEMANLEVWRVDITNVNALAQAVVEAQQQKAQEALEESGDDDEPEQDTQELPDAASAVSHVSTIGGKYSDIVTSYISMFESIPNDPPDDIMIWEGATIGGIEIQSIHWNVSEYNGTHGNFLHLIRGLFASFWFVIYVTVIFYALAVDLFVAGVCLYMVYGLLLGRPQTAVDGMQYMFKLLCSILGWKPPAK